MTRRSVSLVPIVLLVLLVSLAAQQQSAPPAEAAQSSGAAPQDSPPAQASEKTGKEKKDAAEAAAFDESAAAAVLGTIRNGLEGHAQRVLLSAFDAGKMDGYLTFEDQIDALFARYEGFRVTFRILQISEENHRGVILADFQLENEPRGGGDFSRREGQLRFELERGAKGWKIVDLNPREFFS